MLPATMLTRQMFVPLCLLKPLKAEMPAQMDSQKVWQTWTVWLVQFVERNEGKLATFATTIANVSIAKVLCCSVAIIISAINVVPPWHFQTVSPDASAARKKGAVVESALRVR